jgi:Pol polyprotein, beta-barrel domain
MGKAYSLRDLIILNSGSIIYVFNNLSRFANFQKAARGDYLQADSSTVPILDYGNIILQLQKSQVLQLKNVAFCTDFVTNLVSFSLLKARDIY